ncbi:leader peptidase (prepilin peptidase)/N-methyltransferase [Lentzea atacamensis]|uniref:Leader peptidase (Prepilin peptidase)/N-methyltransferase n=1 Tax=Lentzea atacamensis TaxID=531938 RepID=A0ABX9DYA6_9PSEU|nr:prepilin peptidase [Lentzea atacamensis]RAS58993.1 leader peptidase (prepilin peptidase)/N-methyltransferase [Lentzea atacamensis]
MSHWMSYGLLGAVAGPVVMAIARTVTHDEQLSWNAVTRCGWMPLAAASSFLCIALSCVATEMALEANALSWFMIVGLLLAMIDSTVHRLPHQINGALLAGGVIQLSFLALLRSDFEPLLRAGLATAVVTTAGLAVYVGSRQGLGFGDIVLLAPIAFVLGWFGWRQLFMGLLSAFVIAAASMRVLRACRVISRGDPLPLGPFLIASAMGAIVLA